MDVIKYQLNNLDELIDFINSVYGSKTFCPKSLLQHSRTTNKDADNIFLKREEFCGECRGTIRKNSQACWNHFLAKLKSNNYDDLDRLMDYKKILEEG